MKLQLHQVDEKGRKHERLSKSHGQVGMSFRFVTIYYEMLQQPAAGVSVVQRSMKLFLDCERVLRRAKTATTTRLGVERIPQLSRFLSLMAMMIIWTLICLSGVNRCCCCCQRIFCLCFNRQSQNTTGSWLSCLLLLLHSTPSAGARFTPSSSRPS